MSTWWDVGLFIALLDRRAALAGNAPVYLTMLRPRQLLIGAAGLAR